MKALFCRSCGAQLTHPLEIRSGKDPGVNLPQIPDREPITAAGIGFKSYDAIERSFGPEPAPLEFTPQYWLNPQDLLATVRLTKDHRRLGGCCGLAGSAGPNQLCKCSAEVGTLRSDCWTPHVFIPEPAATEWRHFQDHEIEAQ